MSKKIELKRLTVSYFNIKGQSQKDFSDFCKDYIKEAKNADVLVKKNGDEVERKKTHLNDTLNEIQSILKKNVKNLDEKTLKAIEDKKNDAVKKSFDCKDEKNEIDSFEKDLDIDFKKLKAKAPFDVGAKNDKLINDLERLTDDLSMELKKTSIKISKLPEYVKRMEDLFKTATNIHNNSITRDEVVKMGEKKSKFDKVVAENIKKDLKEKFDNLNKFEKEIFDEYDEIQKGLKSIIDKTSKKIPLSVILAEGKIFANFMADRKKLSSKTKTFLLNNENFNQFIDANEETIGFFKSFSINSTKKKIKKIAEEIKTKNESLKVLEKKALDALKAAKDKLDETGNGW